MEANKEKKDVHESVKPPVQKGKRSEDRIKRYSEIGEWFQTICWIKIPVFGFIYMLVLAIRKNTPKQKKSFAIAYLLYRILVLLLAFTILFVLYRIGLSFVDEILQYAGVS
jgi:cation transporter-like permease